MTKGNLGVKTLYDPLVWLPISFQLGRSIGYKVRQSESAFFRMAMYAYAWNLTPVTCALYNKNKVYTQ